jgi:hypothetical protein
MIQQECTCCKVVKDVSAFEWQKNRPNPRKKCQQCRHENRDYEKEYTYRNEKRKEKYWADPQKARQEWETHKYGVCKEDFSYKECYICGSVNRLCIDHCHDTGDVRGILCSKCNTALGMFDDDTDKMKRAIDYLKGGPHFELSRKSYP